MEPSGRADHSTIAGPTITAHGYSFVAEWGYWRGINQNQWLAERLAQKTTAAITRPSCVIYLMKIGGAARI